MSDEGWRQPLRGGAASDSGRRTDTAGGAVVGPLDQPPVPLDLTSPQFTVRAVLTGMVLAGVLSVCNVYVGLKIPLVPNQALPAALLGLGFWSGLRRLTRRRVPHWGILENNINQTVGSSGALVASAGLVAPIPALTMLTGQSLTWPYLALWVLSVMLVGIVVAVPLRRPMILGEKLPFPAGVATAETLREMYAKGTAAVARALTLVASGLAAAAVAVCAQFQYLKSYELPFSIRGFSARSLTMTLDPSLLVVGIGGLIGFRTGCALLIGAGVAYGVIAPQIPLTVSAPLATLPAGLEFPSGAEGAARYNGRRHALEFSGVMSEAQYDALLSRSDDAPYRQAVQKLHSDSHTAQPSFGALNRWLLWPGATLLVVSALLSLALSWRSVLAVWTAWRRKTEGRAETADPGEVPRAWFLAGLVVAFVLSVVLQWALFGIRWWVATAAVLLTFVLAMVAARVGGETGVTPVGPLGKVTQLVFGFWVRGSPAPNLMAANVTGGAASQCADLLDDLKCGYLLGASPRWQALSQVLGALAGALVGSAAYVFLIPNPAEMLASQEWPAPAAASWKAVAELFTVGAAAIPAGALPAVGFAAAAAVLLTLLTHVAPQRLRRFVLSPVGLGLAFVMPASIAILLFIGGLAALLLRHWFRNWSGGYLVPACAGLVAGESLTGVVIAVIRVFRGP